MELIALVNICKETGHIKNHMFLTTYLLELLYRWKGVYFKTES